MSRYSECGIISGGRGARKGKKVKEYKGKLRKNINLKTVFYGVISRNPFIL